MATMNISLPGEMKKWVEDQAATGRYANSSDVVRDILRKAQERQIAIDEFNSAIDRAKATPIVEFYDLETRRIQLQEKFLARKTQTCDA